MRVSFDVFFVLVFVRNLTLFFCFLQMHIWELRKIVILFAQV